MIQRILAIILIFLLGALTSSLYHSYQTRTAPEIQLPRTSQTSFTTTNYPSDKITEEQILVFQDHVILDVQGAQWARFTDTHSMEPTLGANSNAIEFIPTSTADINVGDIASYYSTIDKGIIIHRVVYKGEDKQGTYFIFKGDNNPSSDPEKVRFAQIQRVVAAIIY